MRAALHFVALGVALLASPACFAQAQTPPAVFTTFKPDEIAGILKDAGYRAEVLHENNRYRIHTGMGGRQVTVYLYCDNDTAKCTSLTWELGFRASPEYTLTVANTWNRDKRYAKAYIDTDGGIVVDYDLAFTGGVTKEAVAESARLFDRIVGLFDSEVNNK